MEKNKKDYEQMSPENFEFVQMGEKIYDKKFETKPIGYFKDAMIRFAKNRTNVFASVILGIIILCSIFIPIFSNKNAEIQESRLAYLPPRIPYLEDIGIATGYKYLDNQVVDLSTIDPETGLGVPAQIPAEFIDLDTLENYYTTCNDATNESCVGGDNILSVDINRTHVVVESSTVDSVNTYQLLSLSQATNGFIRLDVAQMNLTDENAVLNLYMKPSYFGEYTLIFSTNEAGVYDISPYEALGVASVTSQLRIEFVSSTNTDTAYLHSIEVYDDTQEEPVYNATGYYLSKYYKMISVDESGGTWNRYNGQVLAARFYYDAYAYAFGPYTITAYPKSSYDQLMIDYADTCTIDWVNPDDPNNWTFAEGCPIIEVIAKVGEVQIQGVWYFSYNLVANYGMLNGYDEIPYFLFGTSGSGKDLFKLIWIGTRTSLLLGVLVSAINISIGVVYGAISGYYGGNVDLIMQRFSEIVGRIPWLVTLSIFIALYGPGQVALFGVLIISGWIGVAGVTRTQFYRYKGREYVLASRTLGAGDGRLIFRHILPNGIGTIITSSILSIPGVIFTESTLSYLGFGIGHGTTLHILGLELTGVSIGVLLSDGRNRLLYEPYLTVFPALLISILMISFNMFGNALRDAFNPALRGSE